MTLRTLPALILTVLAILAVPVVVAFVTVSIWSEAAGVGYMSVVNPTYLTPALWAWGIVGAVGFVGMMVYGVLVVRHQAPRAIVTGVERAVVSAAPAAQSQTQSADSSAPRYA